MKAGREVRATSVAIAFLVFCLAIFASIFAFFIFEGISQTRTQLEERSRAAALNVATNAGWLEQVAQQTLRRVDAVLGPDLSGDETTLQAAVEGLPADVDVYIIGPDGYTIFATEPGTENVSVADREYFTALEAGAAFHTSSQLVARVSGEDVFVFSKRLQRRGAFAGAVVVAFGQSVLRPFWTALDVDEQSTVSLIRRDGKLMARYPAPDGPVDLADHPLITQYLPEADFGTYFSDASPIDGVARVVSYRAVPGTDIVALASLSTAGTWNGLRGAILTVFIIVTPIALGLLGVGFWVVNLLRRDAKRREELEAAQETNVLLFREIHHRVKNNLQSVQSLVRMQDMPKAAKIDLQSRLSAMAAMHEHIYRHDKYEDIDAHDLVPVVVDEVIHAYGADVAVHYDIAHVAVDRDHVTPLALLLSELVTNALKYAFADGRKGEIIVAISDCDNGRCRLVVSDNGVGMGPLPDAPASMGLRLIRGVVSQMGGSHGFTSENGTRFEAELALASRGHQSAA